MEGFHADTGRVRPIGGGYHDNELLRVLERYRILVYEQDRQEWGRQLAECAERVYSTYSTYARARVIDRRRVRVLSRRSHRHLRASNRVVDT